ncbi:hypothetical protein AcV7_003153 [Taiwanofungus camphoratus]|nr:hypothetical protein AcV7_003153 [Antrodia cinnamomea]
MADATLSVAHFGHPLLKGAKHWSLLLLNSDGCAVAYQVTGSTDTYEFKEPEDIEYKKDQTYMGKVDVGHVDMMKQAEMLEVLRKVRITRGDLNWNCQNWVVAALKELSEGGFAVDTLTLDQLAARLSKAER